MIIVKFTDSKGVSGTLMMTSNIKGVNQAQEAIDTNPRYKIFFMDKVINSIELVAKD